MDDLTFENILISTFIILGGCLGVYLDKKKKGKGNIDDVIKNDPVLNKLDKEIGDINTEN